MDSFIVGCHLSFSDSFSETVRTANSILATTFQFFSRNPRGGARKTWLAGDIDTYIQLSHEFGVSTPLAHAPYTLNACSDKPNIRIFARETMADDVEALESIPGAMYNFHPGSHVGQGAETGISYIADCLNASVSEGTVPVLLETMAGKGSEIGGKFEELREIIDRCADSIRPRIGVCLDTCHVYDAGYDIVNDLDGVLTMFDSVVGLGRLRAVHLNDSKNPYSSHKDRHELLGKGSLGSDAFRRVINHPVLHDLPFYLETPNDLEGYAAEIALLRTLREQN